ncbi:MAG TPA: sugar phosphate isomerase/epimerase family protein [Planctomycetota bacterium]|nr:sugar phosphate isomerase/epimerase family protein [Planctomycetota bacterium]
MYISGIADEAGRSIAEQIAAHQELGWKHIELRLIDGVNVCEMPDDAFAKTAEAIAAAKLQVSCFGSAIANWGRPITTPFEKDTGDLKRAMPRMNKLGAKFIRVMSYPNAGWKVRDWRKEVFRRLNELAKMAEQGGVVMVHENCHGYGGDCPAMQTELFEEVVSPAFKIVYDTGNPFGHMVDATAMYRSAKPHIAYVHVKDYKRPATPGHAGEAVACYPGEGDGRVREVLKDLLGSGYDGGLSIEPHMTGAIHLGQDASKGKNAKSIYIGHGKATWKLIGEIKKELGQA